MKYHINNRKEVKPCNASKRQCRYGGEQHFDSEKEAWSSIEKGFDQDTSTFRGLQKKTVNSALQEKVHKILGGEPHLESMVAAGEVVQSEIFKRLSFPYRPDRDLSLDELKEIGAKTVEVMSEVAPNGRKISGKNLTGSNKNVIKQLINSTEFLPDGTNYFIEESKHKISVKKTHSNATLNAGHVMSGYVVATLKKNELSEDEVERYRKIDAFENYPKDSYILEGMLSNNAISTTVVHKDSEGNFKKQWIVLDPNHTVKNDKYSTYRFLEEKDIKLYDYSGEVTKHARIYDTYQKKKEQGLEIVVPETWEDPENAKTLRGRVNSTTTHEYTHLLQELATPQMREVENELFEEIAKEQPIKDFGNFKSYQGFPKNYMGSTTKSELVTSATECLYYPDSSPQFYGTDAGPNANRVSKWIIGHWLMLDKLGREAKTSKTTF